LALLALLSTGSAALADDSGGEWRLDPGIQLQTATYFQVRDRHSQTYAEVSAQFSIDRHAPGRPVSGGLFAEFGLTSSAASSHEQIIGGWLSYQYGRWALSTTGMQYSSNQSGGLRIYASQLQFEARPGHKLSLAAIGTVESSSAPALQLVYKTRLAGRVSLSVNVGLGSNRQRDYGASTKFVWKLL
jgi:hypothetical protein